MVLMSDADTFALANLFQVLESNMGIIGACLPVMRQPLRQYFPRLFGGSKGSKGPSPYYTDDRFRNQYGLQNVSGRQRDGSNSTWHNVSVSGPELWKSAPRKSDELGIISETVETGDRDSGRELDEGSPMSLSQNGIRKNVAFSVERR